VIIAEYWTPTVAAVKAPDAGDMDRGKGVTALEAVEATPVPAELVAVTVKVYAVPLVNPVTVIGEELPVPVIPPGLDVTV
jgi:hypothetical protein